MLPYETAIVHRWMIRDTARTDAFYEAIKAVVKPGDVVLDVGAGSGILSMFAAQAGAARVYAVEQSEFAYAAQELIIRNGLQDKIQIINMDAHHLQLPEKVDVIMSEWLGTIGVDENLLGMVLQARDKWLKPSGVLIPQEVTAKVVPVFLAMRTDLDFFQQQPYGLDLSLIGEQSVHELMGVRRKIRPEDLCAPSKAVWQTDVATVPLAAGFGETTGEVSFEITQACEINAFAAWFDAQLSPSIRLENAPDTLETHWGQLVLPLRRVISVKPGDNLDIRLVVLPITPGSSNLMWTVQLNGEVVDHQDTRYVGHVNAPYIEDKASDAANRKQLGSINMNPAEQYTHSNLTKFLAELAINPDFLRQFIVDPTRVLNEAALSQAEYAAMISRDSNQIQAALYQENLAQFDKQGENA